MRNILFINSSGDGGTYVFIDDLSRLDTFTGDYTPNQVKECKELIEFAINNPNGHKRIDGTFRDSMGVDQGEIWDENGYTLLNVITDCFGFTNAPFTVEYVVTSQSYF